jgi:hypothetical protein
MTVLNDAKEVIGLPLPVFQVVADHRRLRLFASVVGETDPVYTDVAAAHAAGYPDLPIPPTFLFSLELERPDPYAALEMLGADLTRILHAEQSFRYLMMAHANERLEFSPSISDYYEKKDGALRFVVRATNVRRNGELIAQLRNTVVERR